MVCYRVLSGRVNFSRGSQETNSQDMLGESGLCFGLSYDGICAVGAKRFPPMELCKWGSTVFFYIMFASDPAQRELDVFDVTFRVRYVLVNNEETKPLCCTSGVR